MKECWSWKPQSLCNLFSGVTSHHFCHILLIRIESLGQVPMQGEEITQGHEYQEVEITGSNLKSAYHYTRKHEKASIVLSNTLSPPVNWGQQILLYLPLFSHPCLFPMALGWVDEVGLGRYAQQEMKEGSELWIISKEEVSPWLA